MNDNQNYFVRDGRTTSRVLAPSGGQSSLTFGLRPTPPAAKPVPEVKSTTVEDVVEATGGKADETKVLAEVAETTVTAPVATVETAVPTQASTTPTKFTSALLPSQQTEAAISQNAFVSGSNMNGGCVMTGRPSSRVLAPPGGHTSIRLG